MLMVQKDRYFGPGSHAVCSFTELKRVVNVAAAAMYFHKQSLERLQAKSIN